MRRATEESQPLVARADVLGEAKVGEEDVAVVGEQQVVELEVAMDDVRRVVTVVERAANLLEVPARARLAERALRVELAFGGEVIFDELKFQVL